MSINPREVKRMANNIRKCMTGEHYYDKKYKDLRVADVLLVLEDENYHTEETILEALTTLDYYKILEACEIAVEQDKEEYLSEELSERLQKLDKAIRRGE